MSNKPPSSPFIPALGQARDLQSAIVKAQANIPECVATGVVDLTSGLSLAIQTTGSHPSEVLALVAAATQDLFAGRTVTQIEQMFRLARKEPEDEEHYFQEITIGSKNLLHLFFRLPGRHQNFVFVAVCRKDANLGLAIAKTKALLPAIAASL